MLRAGAAPLLPCPPAVTLSPGALRVAFTADFLRKLYELSQAVQNDCERFQQALGGDPTATSRTLAI